jgi:hypothetical protein
MSRYLKPSIPETAQNLKLMAIHPLMKAIRTFRYFFWKTMNWTSGSLIRSCDGPQISTTSSPPDSDIPDAEIVDIRRDSVIEPKNGWIIELPRRLVESSMPYAEETHSWEGRAFLSPPPIFGTLRALKSRRSSELKQAVSIASPWPENYYHFIHDVMPKLLVLDSRRPEVLYSGIPVLVPEILFSQPFFRSATQLGRLADINFEPISEALHARMVTYVVDAKMDRSLVVPLHKMLQLDQNEIRNDHGTQKRIFVTRASWRGRLPRQIDEVCTAFTDAGFDVIDLDGWSLDAQINLFRSCSHVAAIHGAALANLIWTRPGSARALEIVPSKHGTVFDSFVESCQMLDIRLIRVRSIDKHLASKMAPYNIDMKALDGAIDLLLNPSADSDDTEMVN